MSNLMIEGGRRLTGSLPVYGAKNAILPILAACIMTEEEVVLESCPVLSDVANMLEILRLLGCSVAVEGDVMQSMPTGMKCPQSFPKKCVAASLCWAR